MKAKGNPLLYIGGVLSGAMVALILVGYVWTPYGPTAMDASAKNQAPSLLHLLGTDNFGRDIFSRVLSGAGTSFLIAVCVVAIGCVCGILIGSLCGYFGGPADVILTRVCDAITAFPSILLALVVLAVIGPGKYNVIGALGILFIPSFARLVRGEFLKVRDRDFVRSARLMGVSNGRILFVHILPNTWPTLLSGLTIGFNNAVLSEASMSYLSIGVTAPDVSLGRMLNEAQAVWSTAPWCMLCPALVVVLTILGVSLLGEGLRERMAA